MKAERVPIRVASRAGIKRLKARKSVLKSMQEAVDMLGNGKEGAGRVFTAFSVANLYHTSTYRSTAVSNE
jgi:hypothetical protein